MQPPELTSTVASRIRHLRGERRWSARRLAEECAALGMESLSRTAIAKIEVGLHDLSLEETGVQTTALGVTIEDLCAGAAWTVLHLSDLSFSPTQMFGLQATDIHHMDLLRRLCDDLDQLQEVLGDAR